MKVGDKVRLDKNDQGKVMRVELNRDGSTSVIVKMESGCIWYRPLYCRKLEGEQK